MQRDAILSAASEIICGDREAEYGPPKSNFTDIGNLWATYLSGARGVEVNLSAQDVAYLLMLMKLARTYHGPPSDNTSIDLVGYAALAGEVG